MGKLSGGNKDQGCFDSGLLPAQWHRLFPVPAMVQETCQWGDYRSGIGSGDSTGICGYRTKRSRTDSSDHRACKDKSELREYRVLQRIEGMPEIHELRAPEEAGRAA